MTTTPALEIALAAAASAPLVVAVALRTGARELTTADLMRYGIAPRLAGPAANLLPWIELAIGALAFAVPTKETALILMGLYCSMSLLVVAAWRRGARGPCGCFGDVFRSDIGPATALRALVFAVLALALVLVRDGSSMEFSALRLLIFGVAVAVTTCLSALAQMYRVPPGRSRV